MMLQGMRELGVGVMDEVASDAQCKCAVCVCSLQKLQPWALEPPRGILSLWKGSASTATRMGGESTQNQPHT